MVFRPAAAGLRAHQADDDEMEQLLDLDSPPLASTSRLPSRGKGPPDLPHLHEVAPAPSRDRFVPPLPHLTASTSKRKGKNVEVMVLDSDEENDENESNYAVNREAAEKDVVEDDEEDLAALAKLDAELQDIQLQISDLASLEELLQKDRRRLVTKIQSRSTPVAPSNAVRAGDRKGKDVARAGAVDYFGGDFPWKKEIRSLAKETWGIADFRLCQEPAINACLDGRDVVIIMPTGGGKSLIYQLPALMSPGTTVVITPLISLMQDQTYNLRNVGVRAVMLNAATSTEGSRAILARMANGGRTAAPIKKGKGAIKPMQLSKIDEEDGREIKLIFCTPERVDTSKTFMSALQKCYDAGLLARIVIDEAHCTSQMGHDYRKSYLALGKLKSSFPKTPISAVTATAPHAVIEDMLKILGLPRKTSSGQSATPGSTVLSPLYRANLHYSVLPKPKEKAAVIKTMTDYILDKHRSETGIVYCLSQQDTHDVAKGLMAQSGGKIICAVYHSHVDDSEKLRIHAAWRNKDIHCVVATNAFGLGIDAPDVRYVLHHSVSKSMEAYYQESGRAGRDGKDSDCVVFYRSADAARLSTLTYADFFSGGGDKLYRMIEFCEDLVSCRKLLFASYFASTHDSSATFEEGADSSNNCGTCDNCLRDPGTIHFVDVTMNVYRTLKIISAADRQNATLTLLQAVDLVRGNGGGSFSTGGKNKGKGKIDVAAVAGAKVDLSKDDTESLLIHLLLKGLLTESFHHTAYTTLSYLHSGELAARYTRFGSAEDVTAKMHLTLLAPPAKTKAKRKASGDAKRPSKKAKDLDAPKAKGKSSKSQREIDVSDDEEGAGSVSFDFESDADAEVEAGVVNGMPSSDSMVDGEGWEVWGGGRGSPP